MKCYLGVDPGKSGSMLAIYEYDDQPWYGIEWVSLNEHPKVINEWIQKWSKTAVTCYVEEVHSMTGQGVKSTFTFGTSYGQAIQASNLLPIEITMVRPQEWQSIYGLVGNHKGKVDKKNKHKAKVEELFNVDFPITHRIVDSMLIGWMGKMVYEGEYELPPKA